MKSDQQTYMAELTRLLEGYSERRRVAGAQRDKGSALQFLAIRVPVLRRVATKEFTLRGLTDAEKLAVWDYIWRQSPYYEVLAIPLLYYRSQGRRIEPSAFATIKGWAERVDDWGHCDSLAGVLSFLNARSGADVMPFLRKLNASKNIWKIRLSIVSLIHYSGKNAVYLRPQQVFPLLDAHFSDDNKYVGNAVGWVLREMRHVYPGEVDAYVTAHRVELSNVALRKAKIRLR